MIVGEIVCAGWAMGGIGGKFSRKFHTLPGSIYTPPTRTWPWKGRCPCALHFRVFRGWVAHSQQVQEMLHYGVGSRKTVTEMPFKLLHTHFRSVGTGRARKVPHTHTHTHTHTYMHTNELGHTFPRRGEKCRRAPYKCSGGNFNLRPNPCLTSPVRRGNMVCVCARK